MSKDEVYFGDMAAIVGILAGVGIALGVPTIILRMGANLGAIVQTVVIILAVVGGVIVAGVSAFFGAVMPKKVLDHSTDEEHPE